MEVYGAALKKLNAQKNVEKHAAAAKKAHARAVKRLAKRLALKKEAEELLAAKKAAKTASAFSTPKPLNESKRTCSCKTKKTRTGDSPYVRPAKRFSEFTQEEKRSYWKAQKRGWL